MLGVYINPMGDFLGPPDCDEEKADSFSQSMLPLMCKSRSLIDNTTRHWSTIRYSPTSCVSNSLEQQLLEAVDDMFVSVLRHERLCYSQVSPQQLLQHLVGTYNIVTEETLEDNLSRLSAWNLDEGMEVLYTQISNVQHFAAEPGVTHIISDSTAIHLVLTALERTGMFTDVYANWRKRRPADHTVTNFKVDMDHAWKERNRRVKAKDVCYHDALSAGMQALPAGRKNAQPLHSKPVITVDKNVSMYYCWSHSLGFSDKHTSHSCLNKKVGYQDNATIKLRKGGRTNLNIRGPRNCI